MDLLDRVVFTRLHWAMNPTLKRHHNEVGTVTAIGSGANDGNVLVKFDRTDGYGGQWWINASKLETVSNNR